MLKCVGIFSHLHTLFYINLYTVINIYIYVYIESFVFCVCVVDGNC